MTLNYLTIIAYSVFIISCKNNPDERHVQKQKLFVCDEASLSQEQSTALVPSPSILTKVMSNADQELMLSADELKILIKELESVFLINNWGSSKINLKDQEKSDKINKILTFILNAKKTNISSEKIKTNEIIDAVNIAKDWHKKLSPDAYKLIEMDSYIISIPANTFSGLDQHIFRNYISLALTEFLAHNFDYAIAQGLLVDEKYAWKIIADYSPIFRKFLQRKMELLSEKTKEEKQLKRLILGVLRSSSFILSPHDHHVQALKKEFGSGIKVSGLAKASVGVVYLVQCQSKGADTQFVAKAALYAPEILEKKLNDELNYIGNQFFLKALYPEFANLSAEEIKNAVIKEILNEINFAQEEKNIKILSKSYEKFPEINIIKGELRNISSKDYLLMNYIPGETLSNLKKLDKNQALSLEKTLKTLYNYILEGKGSYHADTHEGNIIIDNNNLVTLIDLGRINKALMPEQLKFIHAFERAFAFMKKMPLDRSGNPDDLLFTPAAQNQIRKVLAELVELGHFVGEEREFDTTWEIFFSEYKKATLEPFRTFFIRKMAFVAPQLVMVTRALRALDLLENIYMRLLAEHGIEDFFGF
jgi:hypothetical protein